MNRKLWAIVLGIGAVAGFACGFRSLHGRHGFGPDARRAEFESHIAEVCTRAAERVHREQNRVQP